MQTPRRSQSSRSRRRGLSLIYSGFALVGLAGICSLGVDLAHVQLTKTELQAAADSAAHYAVGALPLGVTATQDRAIWGAAQNNADGSPVAVDRTNDIEFGTYDDVNNTFTVLSGAARSSANAVRITCRRTQARGNPVNLAFGGIIGMPKINLTVRATAMLSGDPTGYVGLNESRMFDTTRFDAYNSAAGPYSIATSTNTATIIGNTDLHLHDSAYVGGNAQYGVSGDLLKDATVTVTGTITRLDKLLAFDPVDTSPFVSANDNANIVSSYRSGTKIVIPNNATLTVPGGTYYLTDLQVKPGGSLLFSGNTTVYLNGDLSLEGTVAHTSYRPVYLSVKMQAGNKGEIKDGGFFYGRIYAPDCDVHHHGGQSFGSVVSKLLCFRQTGAGHYDTSFGAGNGSASGAQLRQ